MRKAGTQGSAGITVAGASSTPSELTEAADPQTGRLAPCAGEMGFLSGTWGRMIPVLVEAERHRPARLGGCGGRPGPEGSGEGRTGRSWEWPGWEGRPGAPALRQVLGHSFHP